MTSKILQLLGLGLALLFLTQAASAANGDTVTIFVSASGLPTQENGTGKYFNTFQRGTFNYNVPPGLSPIVWFDATSSESLEDANPIWNETIHTITELYYPGIFHSLWRIGIYEETTTGNRAIFNTGTEAMIPYYLKRACALNQPHEIIPGTGNFTVYLNCVSGPGQKLHDSK